MPGQALTYHVAVKGGEAETGLHVVRAEVTAPDGTLLRHYAANLLAPGGRAVGAVPLALNDPSGVWLLTVRDSASGVEARLPFHVGDG